MNKTKHSVRNLVAMVGLTGAMLTLVLFGWVLKVERSEQRSRFRRAAESREETLRSIWPDLLLPIVAVQAFFRSSDVVDRDEFTTFTSCYLEDRSGVVFFAWIPRVEEAALAAHEVRGRADGLEGYHVRGFPRSAPRAAVDERALHYPLSYIEPYLGHESLPGLDMASDPRILRVLENACAQNMLTARLDPDWIQPGAWSNCIAIIAPVYSKTGYVFTPEGRQRSTLGFVMAMLDVDAMAEDATERIPPQGLDVVIAEIGAAGNTKILHEHLSRTRGAEGRSLATLDSPLYRYDSDIPFLDVKLHMHCTPAPAFFRQHPLWISWLVLAGGLLLTFLIGYGMYWVSQRESRIKRLIEQRTIELQEKTSFLDTLLSAMPLPVYYKDKNGRYLGANKAFEAFYGIAHEALAGKSVFDLAPRELAELYHAKDEELIRNPGVQIYSATMQDALGRRHDVIYHKATFANAAGEIRGLVGAILDITEQKQMESQLLHSQKMQSIGQLSAGVAHEINTPIQFVGDNLQFLKNSFEDLLRLLGEYRALRESCGAMGALSELARSVRQAEDKADLPYLEDEVPKAIEQSLEGIHRVAGIVGAMKEFSHPSTDEKTPVDINRAIETTATIARNEWKYAADLRLDLDRSLPSVFCLPGDFNQVMLNLIVNAAHAVADALKGREGEKGLIAITTRQDHLWVEIRVSDTGTGIPENVRSRVFDPFFTTKEVGKGTGQGLAMAYTVVAIKHGGKISFETEIGKGTTFIVRLPLGEAKT